MPRDDKREWKPEAHKEQGYSAADRAAAGKLLKDFDNARDQQASRYRHENTRENITLKVQSLQLNIDGQLVYKNTGKGHEKENMNIEAAELFRKKEHHDISKEWKPNDLKKEFRHAIER